MEALLVRGKYGVDFALQDFCDVTEPVIVLVFSSPFNRRCPLCFVLLMRWMLSLICLDWEMKGFRCTCFLGWLLYVFVAHMVLFTMSVGDDVNVLPQRSREFKGCIVCNGMECILSGLLR
jgi:hypothetical protein